MMTCYPEVKEETKRTIAVVTGTRAEYGLLKPVMQAIQANDNLELKVIVTGTHLLSPSKTIDEVALDFEVAATIEMQRDNESGRPADAKAMGRGITGLATAFEQFCPDVVLILGDRIEAFAAASAASVAGIRVAHMHGGDRAEGIADEAIRHAITKLSHIHFPATAISAERIIAMGEEPQTVHLVGSPSIDGLDQIDELSDEKFNELGKPEIVFLMHPYGGIDDDKFAASQFLLESCIRLGNVIAVEPNYDSGREGITRAINQTGCSSISHLPRDQFVGLLKRVHLLVGNSSAGLIEAAAIGLRVINMGSRQEGREKPGNVIDVADISPEELYAALKENLNAPNWTGQHPYGNGETGRRTSELLASFDLKKHPIRKLNSY